LKWEDLTSEGIKEACITSNGTCILPLGVIEKHGNHLPLSTDMIAVRYVAEEAAKIEPSVVFPYYMFGQIAEARHVPGTIAIKPELMYSLLDEVCREISRNGFKKIVILNGHGGNPNFINYFIQSALNERKDYAVYHIKGWTTDEEISELKKMTGDIDFGDHAGNLETSSIMAIAPELVKMDRFEEAGLKNYGRLNHITNAYTGISWYADHPTHFAGDVSSLSLEVGKKSLELVINRVADTIKIIKEDRATLQLQDEFYSKSENIDK
jgi:creatinine amidohydrolase